MTKDPNKVDHHNPGGFKAEAKRIVELQKTKLKEEENRKGKK